jgi:hypothetical protein
MFWENSNAHAGSGKQSMSRLTGLIGLAPELSPGSGYDDREAARYGLGSVRDAAQFYDLWGIDVHAKTSLPTETVCSYVTKAGFHRDFHDGHLLPPEEEGGMSPGIDYSAMRGYRIPGADYPAPPAPVRPTPPASSWASSTTLLIFTFERADYLTRTLDKVAAVIPPGMSVVVSQDGAAADVASVVAAYKGKLGERNPVTHVNHAQKQGENGYQLLSQVSERRAKRRQRPAPATDASASETTDASASEMMDARSVPA